MLVFLPGPIEPEFEQALRSRLEPVVILTVGTEFPEQSEYEWIVSGHPRKEWLERSPRLRGIVIPFAGVSATARSLLLERQHLMAYNLHHNAGPTSELALALLFAAAKSVVSSDQALRRGDWGNRFGTSNDLLLEGRNALLLGYGAIGQRIARTLHVLGMQVRAIRRRGTLETESTVTTIFGPQDLHALLPSTQALIIALPLTPETEGWIGERELALLPSDAILVNVGRGAIVDERALFISLKERRLHAAGLDVWYRYPKSEDEAGQTLPSEYPFHELDNVVLSPHRGGDTRETEQMRGAHLAALLNALAAGETPPSQVDIRSGY